jgi:O-antigen/teichoic acid export membrane protein
LAQGKPGNLLQHSTIYLVLGFLPLGINILLAPIYTRFLSPEDFGIIGLAALFTGFISVFLGGGVQQAYGRFYFDHPEAEEKWKLLSTTFLFIIGLGAILLPLMWLVGDQLFAFAFESEQFRFTNYGYLVFITALITLLHEVVLTYYRNSQNIKAYSLWSLGFFVFSVSAILVGVVTLKGGAMGNIAGRAVGSSSIVIGLGIFFFAGKRWRYSKKMVRSMLRFGLPLMPYALLLFAFNSLDRWMVDRFFDEELLGLYNMGWVLAGSSSVFIYSLYNAVSPEVFKRLTSPEHGIDDPGVKIAINTFVLAVIAFVAVALLGSPLFVKWFIHPPFDVIIRFMGVLFLIYLFQLFYVIYTIPFLHHKKTKPLPFIALFSFVLGAISFYFSIDHLGFAGVFLGLAVTKFSQWAISFVFVKKVPELSHPYLNSPRLHLLVSLCLIVPGAFFLLARKGEMSYDLAYYMAGLSILLLVGLFYGSSLRVYWQKLTHLRSDD